MTSLKNIIRLTIVAVAMVVFAPKTNAQQLSERKHGTVSEQMSQMGIFQDKEYDQISELLDYASKFKGTCYRSGSSSPKGFDCSGFTRFVFKKFGYTLNASSSSQVNNGTPVAKADLKPGDLVFFNGRARGSRVGHVGIVTKVKESGTFNFIHSSSSRGVTVSSSEEPYYKARYVRASRVIGDKKR